MIQLVKENGVVQLGTAAEVGKLEAPPVLPKIGHVKFQRLPVGSQLRDQLFPMFLKGCLCLQSRKKKKKDNGRSPYLACFTENELEMVPQVKRSPVAEKPL